VKVRCIIRVLTVWAYCINQHFCGATQANRMKAILLATKNTYKWVFFYLSNYIFFEAPRLRKNTINNQLTTGNINPQPTMKKSLYILAIALLFSHNTFAQAFAAPRWKPAIRETFGKVRFELYCKTGDWGYAQQFFAANFYSDIFYDIHVKAVFVATLTCGNEVTSNVDFTVKKYGSFTPVNTDKPEELPQGFGSDATGLVSSASDKDCPGREVLVEGYNGNKTRDRISGLGIKKLELFAIQDDGSEVPISNNGEMLGPKVGDQKPAAKPGLMDKIKDAMPDLSSNKPKTAQPANAPQQQQAAPKNDPAVQAQTQQYLNQVNDPNNDAITRARLLGEAQLNATRPGGATAEQKKAIADAQAQESAKNKAAVEKSVSDFAGAMQNVKRSREFDPDRDEGNFWLGANGIYPANTANSYRKYGVGPTLLAPLWLDAFQVMVEAEYIFYQPASINTIASVVNQPASNISNPTMGGELSATLGFGPYLIKKPGAILVLQPTAGMFTPGKFAITNKNVTVSTDDAYAVGNMLTSANSDFIFTYGGYLRFFTNDFGFSLGYMTTNTKTYNLSYNGGSQIKANFDPGMLSFSITFRLL